MKSFFVKRLIPCSQQNEENLELQPNVNEQTTPLALSPPQNNNSAEQTSILQSNGPMTSGWYPTQPASQLQHHETLPCNMHENTHTVTDDDVVRENLENEDIAKYPRISQQSCHLEPPGSPPPPYKRHDVWL